jgi:retron-type reverse transcriptase
LQTSKKLLKGQYKYKHVREIKIKKKKEKFNILTIISSKDKIVQKAFLLILSKIFEGQYHFISCNKEEYNKFHLNKKNKKNYNYIIKKTNIKKKYFILENKTVPIFSNSSFGFRPKKSINSVMQEIKLN